MSNTNLVNSDNKVDPLQITSNFSESCTDNLISNGVINYGNEVCKQRIFKIIVLGDSNVGKTCLTFRFCEGKFPGKTEATIGVDFREKIVQIGNDLMKLQIWDTAGQERFRRSMVQHYYRNVHAILFIYDVTKVQTFENIPFWLEECRSHDVDLNVIPHILIGNKCDNTGLLKVPTNLAQRYADSQQMALFETSAKDDTHTDFIESIFLTLAHRLYSSKSLSLSGPSYHLGLDKMLNNGSLNSDSNRNDELDSSCNCLI